LNQVYIRPIEPHEADIFIGWARENPTNEFDPAVALFPSSTTWCAYDSTGPLAYQTIQMPLMLESLAPRPGLFPIQTASCLKELTQNAVTQASCRGAGEIYFLGSNDETNQFAANHIFEEVPMKVYRLRLADLSG
jgi:hypothetical protein